MQTPNVKSSVFLGTLWFLGLIGIVYLIIKARRSKKNGNEHKVDDASLHYLKLFLYLILIYVAIEEDPKEPKQYIKIILYIVIMVCIAKHKEHTVTLVLLCIVLLTVTAFVLKDPITPPIAIISQPVAASTAPTVSS